MSKLRLNAWKIAAAAALVVAATMAATLTTAIASAHDDGAREAGTSIAKLESEVARLRARVASLETELERSRSRAYLRLQAFREGAREHRAALSARIAALRSLAESRAAANVDKDSIAGMFEKDWDDWDHKDWDRGDWDDKDWDHDHDDWDDD